MEKRVLLAISLTPCRTRATLLALAVIFCLAPLAWSAGSLRDDELHRLREQRRQAHRTLQLEARKSGNSPDFGLLVIPVDFADYRLDSAWDPAAQLSASLFDPDNPSLVNYFQVASRGLLDLKITLAPLVNLEGDRRQYSDIGFNGYSRTRALAREAITAVRDMGLPFRSLDRDGPDGLPGTADDDGQVDGVLILHAAPGQENDTEAGLIQPLQFFLDEPVQSQGIIASFYAVASLQSGLGIWAHETGHLLGMEDRYDFLLHPDPGGADVRSLGGLGRFSLMASGAWGTGEGRSPALPDAYTAGQMGWLAVQALPARALGLTALQPGMAYRIWRDGQLGPEFFLLEVRDPATAAPYDAAVPGGQLLIYHVDESVPEGSWAQDGPGQWHLRVRLVEADGNTDLAEGLDDGSLADLFPGSGNQTAFTPVTQPSSWGYDGNSQVFLTDISTLGTGVQFMASAGQGPLLDLTFGFSPENDLELAVVSRGQPFTQLTATLTLQSAGHGSFSSGLESVQFAMQDSGADRWIPAASLQFSPDPDLPAGTSTLFSLELQSSGWEQQRDLRWVWNSGDGPLDFAASWPQGWEVLAPGPNEDTTWHLWDGAPYLTASATPVLAATGAQYLDSSSWPQVQYANSAHTILLTPMLGNDVAAVRIVHAHEAEVLASGEAMDGGRFFWFGPEDSRHEAEVAGGYTQRINPAAANPLAGSPVFADSLLELSGDLATWQLDEILLPAEPGPWRLGLAFASNSLWRKRGWFVADLQTRPTSSGETPFTVHWSASEGLRWQWPADDLDFGSGFTVQRQDLQTGQWVSLRSVPQPTALTPADLYLSDWPGGPSRRHLLRVVADTPLGEVASRPVVVYPDGGLGEAADGDSVSFLGAPGPNPARGEVHFRLQIPAGGNGQVKVFDVRGRLIRRLDFPAGNYLARWDGRGGGGRPVASGVYFIRLEGSGPVSTRKVVLLN
jgi:immune inhibitor A